MKAILTGNSNTVLFADNFVKERLTTLMKEHTDLAEHLLEKITQEKDTLMMKTGTLLFLRSLMQVGL